MQAFLNFFVTTMLPIIVESAILYSGCKLIFGHHQMAGFVTLAIGIVIATQYQTIYQTLSAAVGAIGPAG
jgi:hypothetical protein